MLERIKNALQERKRDDKGFSLVELAVVIVIIGILVAIAIPVFNNVTKGAEQADIKAAASNGAAIVATNIASGATAQADVEAGLAAIATKSPNVEAVSVVGLGINNFCVTATATSGKGKGPESKGPGC